MNSQDNYYIEAAVRKVQDIACETIVSCSLHELGRNSTSIHILALSVTTLNEIYVRQTLTVQDFDFLGTRESVLNDEKRMSTLSKERTSEFFKKRFKRKR